MKNTNKTNMSYSRAIKIVGSAGIEKGTSIVANSLNSAIDTTGELVETVGIKSVNVTGRTINGIYLESKETIKLECFQDTIKGIKSLFNKSKDTSKNIGKSFLGYAERLDKE
jgi:hypothetical protein